MAKLHSKLVQDSIKYLNSLESTYAITYTPSTYGKRSVSDILVCHRGHYIAIEIKIDKDTLTPLQKRFLRKTQEAKGFATVCWTLDEVKKFIKNVDKIIDKD